MNRYSRQIRLPEIGNEGQRKFKGASVLVIGAGALGCPVLQYLTAAGIGTIGIVDNDWVDETNLQRQVLYGEKDLYKPKPVVAKEKLMQNNPEVNFKAHYIRFTKDMALQIMREYDIIVDCTDNFATRYLINDASVILNKPVVYGAIHHFSGQLMVLNYKNGPTLRCIYPAPPHPLEDLSCDDFGVVGSIAGMIGSLQATEVLKIILGHKGILSGKMLFFDSLNFISQVISFKRDPERSRIKELGEYEDICLGKNEDLHEITVDELREMVSKDPDLKVIDLRDNPEKKEIGFKLISIPFHKIIHNLDLIPVKGPKIFYCDYGVKSSIVINFLRKVHHMDDLYRLVYHS